MLTKDEPTAVVRSTRCCSPPESVRDWRSSVSCGLAGWAKQKGISGIDWLEFAIEWRKLYQPSMEEVRSGRREFTILDVLHRESLDKLIARRIGSNARSAKPSSATLAS